MSLFRKVPTPVQMTTCPMKVVGRYPYRAAFAANCWVSWSTGSEYSDHVHYSSHGKTGEPLAEAVFWQTVEHEADRLLGLSADDKVTYEFENPEELRFFVRFGDWSLQMGSDVRVDTRQGW